MVVKEEWLPNLLVRYIMTDEEPTGEEVYELKFEFKRFDYYLRLRMDPGTKVPIREGLQLGGLTPHKAELQARVEGVVWHKIVELASRYRNQLEIRKIETGRHQLENTLIPESNGGAN